MARLVEEGCCWGDFVIGIRPGASLRTFSEYKLQKGSAWMPWLLTYVSDPWYSAWKVYAAMNIHIFRHLLILFCSFEEFYIIKTDQTHLIQINHSTLNTGCWGGRQADMPSHSSWCRQQYHNNSKRREQYHNTIVDSNTSQYNSNTTTQSVSHSYLYNSNTTTASVDTPARLIGICICTKRQLWVKGEFYILCFLAPHFESGSNSWRQGTFEFKDFWVLAAAEAQAQEELVVQR